MPTTERTLLDVTPEHAEQLKRLSRSTVHAERMEIVMQCRRDGDSLRDIAALLEVSHPTLMSWIADYERGER